MRAPTCCLLAILAAFASGCAADSDVGLGTEVARLEERVDRLEAENEALATRLEKVRQELLFLQALPAAKAPTPANAEPPEGMDLPSPNDLGSFLGSEQGRDLLGKTIAEVTAKKEAERRERLMDYGIDLFAEQAGLDEYQTTKLKELGRKYVVVGREELSAYGDAIAAATSQEERARLRAEAAEKTLEIREQMATELKSLLTDGQYRLYVEAQARRTSRSRR